MKKYTYRETVDGDIYTFKLFDDKEIVGILNYGVITVGDVKEYRITHLQTRTFKNSLEYNRRVYFLFDNFMKVKHIQYTDIEIFFIEPRLQQLIEDLFG